MVIGVRAATPSSDDLAWSGRRHDDDKPGAVRGSSSADLFDTVFHALHDGEQVAVGFGGPLTARVDEDQRNLDGAGQEDRAISLLDKPRPAHRGWPDSTDSWASWEVATVDGGEHIAATMAGDNVHPRVGAPPEQ